MLTRPSPVMLALFAAAVVVAVGVLSLVVLAWVTPVAPALMPAQSARLERLPDGVIRYEDEGEGSRALVLLHGFNGQLGQWDQVWGGLASCGRRIRLDIPGFGASEWNATSYALPEQGERIVAFLDSRGVTTATLVGGSMGGSLTAWIAAHYPERVDQIGLLAPSGYTGALRYPGLLGILVRPGWPNRLGTAIARSRVYATLFPRSRALQTLTVTGSYGPGWVNALGHIRAPALILWSRGDEGVSHTTALDVRQAIAGSTLVWLDKETGHEIPRARPELVGAVACQLAGGSSPADIARRLQTPLLRPGEAIVVPDNASSDK